MAIKPEWLPTKNELLSKDCPATDDGCCGDCDRCPIVIAGAKSVLEYLREATQNEWSFISAGEVSLNIDYMLEELNRWCK